MDSDLSHKVKYIPEFIKKMKQTDCHIVTGARYTEGGGVIGWGLFRHFTSQVANFLADSALNIGHADLTGSFRLYKRSAFETLTKEVISKGYAFQMEILARAKDKNWKIEEVPIVFVERIYQQTKFGAGEVKGFLNGVKSLWKNI